MTGTVVLAVPAGHPSVVNMLGIFGPVMLFMAVLSVRSVRRWLRFRHMTLAEIDAEHARRPTDGKTAWLDRHPVSHLFVATFGAVNIVVEAILVVMTLTGS
ncbi:hypothetical protein R8Z50_19605 [Longispora sp. K20-0274]|uniref:hypothetical protein n=1 Tax=Longispora sp. K20-0274 TaxID=3088255 RepID=UPI00399BA449